MRVDNCLLKSLVACAAWLLVGAIAAGAASAQNAPAGAPAVAPAPAATTAPAPAPAPSGEPAIIRVWSSDIHDAEDKDPGGTPAVTVVSPRGGVFSGKVVVGGSGTIVGLKATAGDLKGAAGTIPADRVQVRYGVAWDSGLGGRLRPKGADILLDQPPAEAAGGKVPVWLTIRVPPDAKAGTYAGTLTVEAKSNKPVAVPVSLEVVDWTVPAPQDYRTVVELIQSPDTLALEYNVPLWSDKHWALVSQSLRLMSRSGSRTVYVPLICQTNQGNEQTMVRWIRKGEGQYEHDFSVLEKYLDLVEKGLGKPKFVVLYAWDVLLTTPPGVEAKDTDSPYQREEKAKLRARAEEARKGVPVTGYDPASGKAETIRVPGYADPAAKALWQPVYKGIRERLAKRGLEKAMMLGMSSDWRPSKPEMATLAELSGNLPWASCSHHLRGVSPSKGLGKIEGTADYGLAMIALDFEFVADPNQGRLYGWKKPYLQLHCWQFPRYFFSGCSLSTIRQEVEVNITGGQRGIGRIGADFWPCIRNKAGDRRVAIVTDRYPQAYWHSLNVGDFLLAPGPAAPAGTARLEVFQEGLQECEARIAIETVLTDDALRGKLGPELARKAQETLDERQRGLWLAKGATQEHIQLTDFRQKFWDLWLKQWDSAKGNAWFVSGGWQKRTAALFAVAGEVEKKALAKP